MLLLFEIAKTQMLSRLKQSIIATLGVTFGIGMFILMISFMTGVNTLLEETMLSATPHIRIYNDIGVQKSSVLHEWKQGKQFVNVVHHIKPKKEKKNLKNGFAIVEDIRKDEQVLGVSPQVSTQVFYNYGAIQIGGSVVGVNIFEENKLFDLVSKMQAGRIEDLLTSNDGILMGVGLARKLNMNIGDKVTVSTPDGTLKVLQVRGIFKYGIGAIDDTRSYANISTVQKMLKEDTRYITDINLKLKDYYQAKTIAQAYQKRYNYKIEDWETANATILVSFTLRNIITYVTSITLLVVAGFGIYNILNMTIYEKMRDIAILKAQGFAEKDVLGIFMIQALTIGVLGGVSGLLIGFLLSWWVSTIPFDSGGFLATETFPVNFNPFHYAIGIVFGVLTTIFAGYFPARKAGKIDPVEILRG
ncbi:ABC transporter permease [Raineya orbicola]|jgi:lipoprotein-releasing system permease protein|uniref:ABC-type transport system n=1 Tax=Raineya orbicola TaxID=2016530 RepID=A0A2N3IGD9_9BACT|nr:ABC transporter permease [Raineya orbicola]PKQ69328.1 ABC-type transport system [Raineya orbicola]